MDSVPEPLPVSFHLVASAPPVGEDPADANPIQSLRKGTGVNAPFSAFRTAFPVDHAAAATAAKLAFRCARLCVTPQDVSPLTENTNN